MPERFVATSAYNAAVYHTHTDCSYVSHSKGDPKPVSDNAIGFHDLEMCPECEDAADLDNHADTTEHGTGDAWRYECPNGHRNVRSRQSGGFYCHTCGESHDEVRDLKTDTTLSNRRGGNTGAGA